MGVIISEKEKDFYRAYKETIKRHGKEARYMNKRQLIEETCNSPASSFHIDGKRALRIYNYYKKHGHFGVKRTSLTEKYEEIVRRYDRCLENTSVSNNIKKISMMEDVCMTEAPKFYVSTKEGFNLYYNVIHKI